MAMGRIVPLTSNRAAQTAAAKAAPHACRESGQSIGSLNVSLPLPVPPHLAQRHALCCGGIASERLTALANWVR